MDDEKLNNRIEVLRQEFRKGLEAIEQASIMVERKESQSSYEFGKPGDRHKIYYWSVEDLMERLQDMLAAGLINELPGEINGD